MLSGDALRYSDSSVLERHHLESAFSLLHTPGYNFLRALKREDYRVFRSTVISMVLATDLKNHFEFISRLKAMKPGALVPPPPSRDLGRKEAWTDGEAPAVLDAMFALEVCIKFCDLGHAAKPWEQHERWSEFVLEEFFLLGDQERKKGWEVSPLCNREKDTDVPKAQQGFFNFVVLPFSSAVARALPESEEVGDTQCRANFEVWRQRAQTAAAPAPAPAAVITADRAV